MPKKQPTTEQQARVLSILESYGDGSEQGVFREKDVEACRAVAKSMATREVKTEQKRLHEAAWARLSQKLGWAQP